jgi:SAM-dependent methyltransferase
MQEIARAPNRLLDLDELETPAFHAVLARLDELVERDKISYLHPSKRWEYPWALERAGLAPGSRVLDVGCGDSVFPVYLASLAHRVAAVDVEFTTNLGALHGLSTGYTRADMRTLPFTDEEFDAVFCISVIEHLPESQIPVAMQELRRVLKPGGRLLLTTDYYEDASERIWYRGPDRDAFPVDWGIFDEKRLPRLILSAPGYRMEGELDLSVDWEQTRRRMRAFHGYPYTSVGVALVRE